jgi:hypothetical protein
MKKIILSLFVAAATLSCSNESVNVSADASSSKPAASVSNVGDYAIALSVSTDGTVWTYTITRAKASAKNLSHFIIDLNNCGDKSASFGDIVWATVNGSPADLTPTEGSGTNCNPQGITSNFVKFDNIQPAASWVLVMKLDKAFDVAASTACWFKAGNSCNQSVVPGPGCPIEEYCTYAQGFFFANGAVNNSATAFWTNGLTIGGVNYTQAQGNMCWFIDRGRGGSQIMNSFFQLSAVRLSGAESACAADAAIVDAYFTGINVCEAVVTTTGHNPYSYFNLPLESNGVTKAQVIAAGGRIGSFIDANHCR